MIGIRLEGRLGNQLFQYAFIYAAAKKLGTKFYIDCSVEPFRLPPYFELSKTHYDINLQVFNIKGYKNIFNYHLKKLYYGIVKRLFLLEQIQIDSEKSPEEELIKIKNNALYLGFFQSEKYFAEETIAIKAFFKIKPAYEILFLSAKKNIPLNKKVIVVHIRRGDYMYLGLNLPLDYYHHAIKQAKVENAYYVFLSDEPDFIASEFAYINQKYISNHSEIIDFQFMMDADMCILSNSSFSWWGAYLNRKNAKVFAPKYWLGQDEKEAPNAILLPHWIKL